MIESSTEMSPLAASEPRRGDVWRSAVLHALVAVFLFLSGGFIVTAPLSLFVPLVFISISLRHGNRAAIASASLFLAIFGTLAVLLSQDQTSTREVVVLAAILLSVVAPSLVAARHVRLGASSGATMVASLGSAAAAFGAVEMVSRALVAVSPFGVLVESFRDAGRVMVDTYRRIGVEREALEGMSRISAAVTEDFLPLLLLAMMAISLALSIAAVPRMPAKRKEAGSYLFRFFRLPDATLFLFVIGGLSPLASGSLRVAGLNLLGIVLLLYVFEGMAVLRHAMVRRGVGPFGTTLMFILASVLAPYAGTLFFLAGLFDPFFDFRKLNRKEESNESDLD
jgi:hypothetical protein